MRTTTAFAFLSLAICCASPAYAVTFDWATIGNPGNAADQLYPSSENPDNLQFGAVNYTYRISKHEVTNAQYAEFLNAVAATDTNVLYGTAMETEIAGLGTTWRGITRSGSSGSYTYAVKADAVGQGLGGSDYTYANKPVVGVSFFNAMRFVNWLENGQPTGAQGPGTTEEGVYTISDGLSETRAASAMYFIPSEDEWYKAAYHKNDGVTGNYWDYPTSTDAVPNNNLPSSDTGNSANFDTIGDHKYPYTDVGAYTLSDSPYGTFDQGGNVWEWNEAVLDFYGSRGVRGGFWAFESTELAASSRHAGPPAWENEGGGFRVASIPEPSPADFDLDGDVDGDDFLKWQVGFGTAFGATKMDGDFDNDGDVDRDDFLGWRGEFGSQPSTLGGGSISAAAVVVPEPASIVLLIVALIGAICLSRRH